MSRYSGCVYESREESASGGEVVERYVFRCGDVKVVVTVVLSAGGGRYSVSNCLVYSEVVR